MKRILSIASRGVLSLIFVDGARAQWAQIDGTENWNVYSLVTAAPSSESTLYAGTWGQGIFCTTPDGSKWIQRTTGLSNEHVTCFTVKDTNVFAGTANGIFHSTLNDTVWTPVVSGLASPHVRSLANDGYSLLAGTLERGVFRSSDNGLHWSSAGLDGKTVFALLTVGSTLYAGTSRGVFLSTDTGGHWDSINTGLTDSSVYSLALCPEPGGDFLLAGTISGAVFILHGQDTSWTSASSHLITKCVSSLSVITVGSGPESGEPMIFAGTWGDGVFRFFSNNGDWVPVNTGLTELWINSLCHTDSNLVAGSGTGIWCRALSELTTSVKAVTAELPSTLRLKQNYPNPFSAKGGSATGGNPRTTIEFSITVSSRVSLTVYDIRGSEVSSIIDEPLSAGTYTTEWDASALPSGVYFCMLRAGRNVETRKLLLVK